MSEKLVLWIAAGLAIFVILYLLHRTGLWAEKKGWIYYRTINGGTVSYAVLQEVDLVVNNQIRHTIEAKQHVQEETVKGEGDPGGNSVDKKLS